MGRKLARGQTKRQQPDPSVFDVEHLRRYTLHQAGLELELIGLFQQQLPDFLAQISVATSAYEWKVATHSLKGSAATIGAKRIALIAESLEMLGEAGRESERERQFSRLRQAIADFDRAIRAFYS
jgi:HPt (histidine-containing phosphotransfer) domain-containing protein